MNRPPVFGVAFGVYEVSCACGECRNTVHSSSRDCAWTFCDECYLSGHAEDCPDRPGELPCP